jgi:hypothetical protein
MMQKLIYKAQLSQNWILHCMLLTYLTLVPGASDICMTDLSVVLFIVHMVIISCTVLCTFYCSACNACNVAGHRLLCRPNDRAPIY